jgi:hypothetical protein
MFQNAAIDVAIGLALMYLLLSLTCTIVNEYIASKLDLRSKSLGVGLEALLDDPDVRKAFYGHGIIAGTRTALMTAGSMSFVRSLRFDRSTAAPRAAAAGAPPSGKPHPSYVSTNAFVAALLGSLTDGKTAAGPSIPTLADLESAILKLPPSNLRDALVTNLTVAQGDFDKFRRGVATWFDDSMERLSGAYRRHLKFISIAVGCVLASLLNADTFVVSRALWSDSALRAQMVQVADSTLKAGRPTDSATGQSPKALSADDIKRQLVDTDSALRPLPIGWSFHGDASLAALEQNITSKSLSYWPLKLLGLFATGLALSFGAPFWFDALSKFMNVRAAGAKPERQT